MGFEAEGAAAIVRGERIYKPETLATAIRIGNPASWTQAVTARDESNGVIDKVSDEEILEAISKDHIEGFSLLGGEPFEPENQQCVCDILK